MQSGGSIPRAVHVHLFACTHPHPPVLLGPHAGTRDLEEAVRAVVAGDLLEDAALAPDTVTLLAEVELVEGMVGEGRCIVGRRTRQG